MAQSSTNLNSPPVGQPVLSEKGGLLSAAWAAWFGALGAVASWMVSGLFTAGSLLLTTAPVTPPAGKLFAGDAARTAMTFLNGWVNFGGSTCPGTFIKLADGMVHLGGTVGGGVVSSTICTLPPGYRPSADRGWSCSSDVTYCRVQVLATGEVKPVTGAVVWIELDGISFLPEA